MPHHILVTSSIPSLAVTGLHADRFVPRTASCPDDSICRRAVRAPPRAPRECARPGGPALAHRPAPPMRVAPATCRTLPRLGCSVSTIMPLSATRGSARARRTSLTGPQGMPFDDRAASHSSVDRFENNSHSSGTTRSALRRRASKLAYSGSVFHSGLPSSSTRRSRTSPSGRPTISRGGRKVSLERDHRGMRRHRHAARLVAPALMPRGDVAQHRDGHVEQGDVAVGADAPVCRCDDSARSAIAAASPSRSRRRKGRPSPDGSSGPPVSDIQPARPCMM